MRTRIQAVCSSAVLLASVAVAPAASEEPPERSFLPDFSDGYTARFGPFWWGRSIDAGEDLRWVDGEGRPDADGEFLWAHQFSRARGRGDDQRGVNRLALHARNNLVVTDPAVAWQVQPSGLWLHTPGAHNAKISLGYVPTSFRFEHGDNTDLEHLADAPRVVLFIPIRHDHGNQPGNPATPYISTHYAAQSISVLEFAPGEIIRYEWFQNRNNLDPHILCDLVPYLPQERVRPGVSKPLVRFDLTGEPGGWRVRMEFDGRDGLAGGPVADDWDVDVRSGDDGARPYTIDLDPADSAWSMSLFSPGGRPAETSQMLIGMQPYARADDQLIERPEQRQRVRRLPVAESRE